ncbi:hypothetical protein F53441_9360 [Fusarium austroafricanum]|uniref:Enoyl reductase (ER) domain-containing protein n=1 Tax=Fusarium austroafricanum TaxID=2364996 RepID=A0A8H4NWF4_9HYPO|nr:hypothetical protein F53441_9360 [Fusarium austroafricanum]
MTSFNLPTTMKPVPVPSHPGDVLVKVHATSPCKGEFDWFLLNDSLYTGIPGQDLAGTVVLAPEDSGFKPGDEIYARIEASRPGAAAEYVLARVSELAIRPKNLSWAETAACPISALTAYQSLFTKGLLHPKALAGDEAARKKNSMVRLLINGAAGAVGSWTVQMARLAGVETIAAVVGTQSIDFIRQLGATEIIDYKKQIIREWVAEDPESRQFDLVLDCIGKPDVAQTWYAVRDGGILIAISFDPEESRLGDDLDVITKLLEAGKLKPNIDSVVGLDDFEEAWDKVESGRAKGKVVVKIIDEE